MRQMLYSLMIAGLLLALTSCSGGSNAVTTMTPAIETGMISGGSTHDGRNHTHILWGLWQFSADLNAQTLDVIPLRASNFHLNTLPFLEPPALVNLTLESLKFTGNIIDADIGLRHPFIGLTEFTGFDVCGIFIANGSVTGFTDTALRMAGKGDTRLLNPDGYSRWWNPAEFPHGNNISSYKDGLLGTPDSIADYNSTLNAYKYFCDDLQPNDPLGNVTLGKRGMFSAGKKNIRHYTIDMGSALVFNYAVDACWQYPSGGKPWVVPDDFGPLANRIEAWRVNITETQNTLWNDGAGKGGDLKLSIDVYDWFNAGLNAVRVESPGNFTPATASTPSGGGMGYSTYTIDIIGATPQASGAMDILVSVVSEEANFQDFIPGVNTTAYFIHATNVSGQLPLTVLIPNGGEKWPAGSGKDITWVAPGGIINVKIEYSKDDFASDIHEIVASTPNDGSFTWSPIPSDPTDTAKVRISDVGNPLIFDISDDYFSITLQAIYVDDSNTSGIEDGTKQYPYNTIQEGLTAATAGYYVLVDDSGIDYIGPITLKAGVILKSLNWDASDGDDRATIRIDTTTACVTGVDAATIDGFDIDPVRCGIVCSGASPEILNCRIFNCRDSQARGIWLRGGSRPHIDGCEVYDVNNATDYGYATFHGISIEDCDAVGSDRVVIEHTIVHRVFSSDIIGLGGGYCYPHGIYIANSDGVHIKNCIVHDITGGNYYQVYGIRVVDSADVRLVNNTIYDVDKTYFYGEAYGLYFTNCTNLDARNLIISHVHKGEGGTGGYYQSAYGVYQSGSTYYFEYCDVYDCQTSNYNNVTPGTGCISANPLFVNPGTDFHLGAGSPCKDTGDPSIKDWDNSKSDMGAYGGPGGNW